MLFHIDRFRKSVAGVAVLVCGLLSEAADARVMSPDEALGRLGHDTSLKAAPAMAKGSARLVRRVDGAKAAPALYVFATADNRGMMILPADDCVPAVLGYCETPLDGDNLPPDLEWWLSEYTAQIDAARSLGVAKEDVPDKPAIAPLVTTKWDQGDPYNDLCPEINGTKCYTGCVATAFAQVMNYYKWPLRGAGAHSYKWRDQTLSIDFSQIEFDWDGMADTYSDSSDERSRTAVATLMKACGYSIDMNYGTSSSGAVTADISETYPYFDYNDKAHTVYRVYHSTADWEEIVYDQLSRRMPLIYNGRDGLWSNSVGHCFVCDGYDGAGFYHFNWGWGGYCDGWYRLTAVTPNGSGIGGTSAIDAGYNTSQGVIVNFRAANFTAEDITDLYGANFTTGNVAAGMWTSTCLYASKGELAPETMDMGLEIANDDMRVFIYLGECPKQNNAYYRTPETLFTADFLGEHNIAPGTYTIRYLYRPASEWMYVTYPIGDRCGAVLSFDGNTTELAAYSKTLPLAASDVRFNGLNLVRRGSDNALTYTISNASDEAMSVSMRHYLVATEGESEASLYNFTLHFEPRETKNVELNIRASKIANLPDGKYNILITAGNEIITNYVFEDPDLLFTLSDFNSTEYNDGTFTYVLADNNSAVIAGLLDPTTKLTGDVVVPDVFLHDGQTYAVTAMLPAFDEIADISSITSVDYRAPLAAVPNDMFHYARELKAVKLPAGLRSIGYEAFCECSKLVDIELPSTLSTIGERAFYGCDALETITIPSSLKTVATNAFGFCLNLQTIILEEGVRVIDAEAFRVTPRLKTINLPSTLELIGTEAFSEAKIIEKIDIKATTPPVVLAGAFAPEVYQTARLIVPAGAKHAYAEAETWREFCFLNARVILNPGGSSFATSTLPITASLNETAVSGWYQIGTHDKVDMAAGNEYRFEIGKDMTYGETVTVAWGAVDESGETFAGSETYCKVDPKTVLTVYVKSAEAPNLYAWYNNGVEPNGAWPGARLSNTREIAGDTYYYYTFASMDPVNIIFNIDGNYQTGDITDVSETSFFEYDGNGGYKKLDVTELEEPAVIVTPPGGTFSETLTVTLCANRFATSSTYSINGSSPVAFSGTTTISIGADMAVGESATLRWTAGDGTVIKEGTEVYTKTDEPAVITVYYDNSITSWDKVNIHIWGLEGATTSWPGVATTFIGNDMWEYTFPVAGIPEGILFCNAQGSDQTDDILSGIVNGFVVKGLGNHRYVTGVDDIAADIAVAPVEYYNLQGIRVDVDNLIPGIYLRRQGDTVTRLLVR